MGKEQKMGKFIDLSGCVFGKLTVLERVEKPENRKTGTYWRCSCECGNVVVYEKTTLINRKISCGCEKEIDLTGVRFGKLLVIGLKKRKNNIRLRNRWKCLCDCGSITYSWSKALTSGDKTSCRMCTPLRDLSGQKFGKLTVTKYLGLKGKSNARWECQCDCGNVIQVYESFLKKAKSCGCSNKGSSLPLGETIFNRIYDNYLKSSKARNLVFEISRESFKEIASKNCHYCNEPPPYKTYKMCEKNGGVNYHGLDRVDNNVGYVISNVVPCCEQCNRTKLDYDLRDFLLQIKKIYENLNLQNYSDKESVWATALV